MRGEGGAFYPLYIIRYWSDCNGRFDEGVRVVADQLEIVEFELEDVFDFRVQLHLRQRAERAGQLEVHLVEVVEIDVCIAKGVDKFAGFEPCYLSHHEGEEGIGRYVERHAQEYIGTALVELARKFSIGNIELEKKVTGGQSHFFYQPNIPSADDDAA